MDLFLVEDIHRLGVVAQFVEIQPVVSAKGLFLRPDFVEGVGVVERAGFHDHGDVRSVVDVVEGIGVEDHQSASLPTSSEPRSLSAPRKCAPCTLATSSAPMGPVALEIIQTSQCEPMPCACPCEPIAP